MTESVREVDLEQFKKTLDQTLDCVFMYRADDLRFIYVNEGGKQQVGYTEDEILRMTVLDIKAEFTPERFRQLVQPLLDGTEPSLIFQTLHRHKDEHDIPVEVYLQLVRDEGREPRFVTIVRDMTERKHGEKMLADFKAALDEHAIVARTDARGTITYVNDKFCEISKYSREELIGQDHRIINSGHHPKAYIRELWQTITNGRTWRGEVKNRAKDGTFNWGQTTIVPFLDAAGKPSQYISVRADITARKQAEAELDNFFTLSLDLLCIGGMDGYYKRINPAFTQLLGYTPDELLTRPWLDFIHPDDRAATECEMNNLRLGLPTIMFENRHQCKDGSWRWLSWKAQPVAEEGLIYATARDLTERRRAQKDVLALNEDLIRRAVELETLNKELEAFSYSVSHDLRAPLRHIDGFAELLVRSAGPVLDERSRRYVNTISHSAKEMGQLIDDLLVFSHMGRSEMRTTRVSLGQLARDAAGKLDPDAQGRSVSWNIGALPLVQGDPVMLRLVLVNLLSNALKYTRTRAQAEIEVGSCNDHSGEVVVFVRDNGVGFDMQYVDKLFGVFQRLHTTKDFEGTGIGLANVRSIIRRHGGRTWAEGAVDGGATFYFSLPGSMEAPQ